MNFQIERRGAMHHCFFHFIDRGSRVYLGLTMHLASPPPNVNNELSLSLIWFCSKGQGHQYE